jgi:hypothetical protein
MDAVLFRPMKLRAVACCLFFATSVIALGCSSKEESPPAEECPAGYDADEEEVQPKFSDIQSKIMEHSCSFVKSCHGEAKDGNLFLGHRTFTSHEYWEQLIDVPGTEAPDARRVVPFKPEQSLLYAKLTGDFSQVACNECKPRFDDDPECDSPCGDLMPHAGCPLSSRRVEVIRQWIADGAKDD